MAENKTQPTTQDVFDFVETLDDRQQSDCRVLIAIMQNVSGQPPVMWGKSIVGFGKQPYKYASGREGDWMKLGFAPRKGQISLYCTCDLATLEHELADLGKYTTGKGCIYIKKLADVRPDQLETLIKAAYDNAGSYTEA